MCFDKGRGCLFLKFWEIKNSSTKKGRLASNKRMGSYLHRCWKAVQNKLFPLNRHRKEKKMQKAQ